VVRDTCVGRPGELIYHCCCRAKMKSGVVYVYLAVGCGFLGVLITYVTLFICYYLGIDISKNLWIITIPIVLAVTLNIFLIELYSRFKK
jgi:hypothetical protein